MELGSPVPRIAFVLGVPLPDLEVLEAEVVRKVPPALLAAEVPLADDARLVALLRLRTFSSQRVATATP